MHFDVHTQNRPTLGSTNNGVVMLIGINAVLYVLLMFFKIFYFMTATGNVADITLTAYHNEVFKYFVLPSSFHTFWHQPWTLLSYMFTHESILNFLSNLLWLAAFGYILQSLGQNKKIIPLYLYGGIAGALAFMTSNIFVATQANQLSYLINATIPIVTIATAATTFAPKFKLLPMLNGGIPLWILYIVFLCITISSGVNLGYSYLIAIAISAFVGFLVIKQLKKGNDYSEWIYKYISKIDDVFNPNKKAFNKPKKNNLSFYKSTRQPFTIEENITQERIDEILDKINHKGISALSKAEKELLNKVGKN